MKSSTNNNDLIVIGDIHGSTMWKKVVEQNPHSIYLFLGDYLDPYEKFADDALIDNLKAIVTLSPNSALHSGNADLGVAVIFHAVAYFGRFTANWKNLCAVLHKLLGIHK